MSGQAASSDAFTISRGAVRWAGIALAAVIVLVVAALLVATLLRDLNPQDPLASAINPSEYQAVFLSNGQVYFGKLTAPGGEFCYLRHVYYLSAQASPQGGKKSRQTLIHLGSEIHGPEDLMIISRRQILFVENLKPTGAVSRTINGGHSP